MAPNPFSEGHLRVSYYLVDHEKLNFDKDEDKNSSRHFHRNMLQKNLLHKNKIITHVAKMFLDITSDPQQYFWDVYTQTCAQ